MLFATAVFCQQAWRLLSLNVLLVLCAEAAAVANYAAIGLQSMFVLQANLRNEQHTQLLSQSGMTTRFENSTLSSLAQRLPCVAMYISL